jgi:glycosyltransferase involved in cell wall biosynthesis
MRDKSKICIVTPGHLVANPRVIKEAASFTKMGFEVAIICGDYIRHAKPRDLKLVDSRWQVTHVPFGSMVATFATHLRQKVAQRLAHGIIGLVGPSSTLAPIALSPIARDLTLAALATPADLYVGHYVAGLPAAALAAKRHNSQFAFDAEDFHLGDLSDDPANDREKSLIRNIEATYLPLANYVTAASPLIGLKYAETYGIKCPTTILNTFPRPEGTYSVAPLDQSPSMYWFSQTIGPDRGLELAVRAIAMSRSRPHFYVRGNPVPSYIDSLQRLAIKTGIEGHLHFLEPCEPTELERLGSVYDLGFVGEQAFTQNRQIALTNKLFSYLTSGIPIVASDISAHQEVSHRFSNALKLFKSDDPGSLARCLDLYLMNPIELQDAKAQARRLAQLEFNWENEEQKHRDVVLANLSGT